MLREEVSDRMRIERRRGAGVDVARRAELERDALVAHVSRERSEPRDAATLDGRFAPRGPYPCVLDEPDAVTDAVRAADLDGLPDRGGPEAPARVDGDHEVLAVAQLERLEMPLGRVAGLLSRDVEANAPAFAVGDRKAGHLERVGAV